MTTRLLLTLGTYRGSSWFHCPSATGSVAGRELEVDVQFSIKITRCMNIFIFILTTITMAKWPPRLYHVFAIHF